uniref:Uncharacterized protein n=1 Tax=Dunaliella tertiolecta TaxID=3047 RepID=A0A7S3R6V8_DUNTE
MIFLPCCSSGNQKPFGWSMRTQPGFSADFQPWSLAPLRGQSDSMLLDPMFGLVLQNMPEQPLAEASRVKVTFSLSFIGGCAAVVPSEFLLVLLPIDFNAFNSL